MLDKTLVTARLGGRHRRILGPGGLSPASWLTTTVTACREAGFNTVAVALLFALAWLRVVVPTLLQLLDTGRPKFNARQDVVPALGNYFGAACTLAFLLTAVVLAVRGVRTARRSDLKTLAVLLGPLIAVQVAGLVNHQSPGIAALAFPLAAIGIWYSPPRSQVLTAAGVLGLGSAVGSMLLAVVRPDLGLLAGNDAGAKAGGLGGLLAGPYLHSNVLGIALALALPLVLMFGNVVARGSAVAVVLLALLWTGSRTCQVAAVIVLVTYALLWRFPAKLWIASVTIGAGLALAVITPLVTTDPAAFTRRGRIWRTLLDLWTDRPVLGYGPDFLQTNTTLAKQLGGQFTHGHNLLVQLLISGGLVNLALFGLLLYVVWRRSLTMAAAGNAFGLLFLVAFVYVSWLEASHLTTTLNGYATWLPLILIVGLVRGEAARRPASAEPSPQAGS